VAPDSNWGIAEDILSDPALAAAVDVIGAHYPGTYSTAAAVSTGKQLWASEDDSTYNNGVGAGCWARVINRNYVNGEDGGWGLFAVRTAPFPSAACPAGESCRAFACVSLARPIARGERQ
jgi:hypothetical protein